ncbi:MAG: DNA polymerase III subunit gamma/tau [Myxococcota bacterium]
MSYQVIARKWRPQTFEEVSGQGHVTRALRNAIQSGRIPHAILFTGPRGVGKTTLARLVARGLNCEKGPTDTPCGVCPSCVEIAESRSTDVQEIDAASRTGVDDMREIIESIRYAAAPGRHRIFIIDEVHMLSTAAFNALLKTLEEPPPRSLFIFATTNPEKIPFTVLSRCQRHDLRRIALSSVTERLAEICRSEGITISAPALAAIAREGEGSMRDAQTLLDQIVAYGGQRIADEVVAEILDLVDRNVLKSIVEACIAGDPRTALEQLAGATGGGSEAGRIAESLLELLRDLTVLQIAPDAEGLFEGTDEEREALRALGASCEPARLRRMFRALVREIEDLAFAPKPSAVLEMAIIRLATMPAGDDVETLLARLDQLERRLAGTDSAGGSGGAVGAKAPVRAGGSASGGPATGSPVTGARELPRGVRALPPRDGARPKSGPRPPAAPERASRGADERSTRDEPDEPDDFDGPPAPDAARFAPAPRPDLRASIEAEDDAVFGDPNREGGAAATDDENGADPMDESGTELLEEVAPQRMPASLGFGERPGALFDRLRARAFEIDRARHASLEHAECVSAIGDRMRLAVSTGFHMERVRTRAAELETLAKSLFGRALKIEVELQAVRTPAQETAESRERSRRRRQEALNSEAVNLAIEILDAEIVEIRPLGDNR